MKKAFLQTLLCLPLLGLGLQAEAQNQPHICGTSIAEQTAMKERLAANRANRSELMERLNIRRDNGIMYIPLQFHLVGLNDGTGYLSLDNLWANMCRLNADYEDQNIQFYLYDAPNYIANSALYNNDSEGRAIASYLMNIYRKPEAVNLFIGNVIGGTSRGTTLGYYTAFPDVIYAIKSTINGGSKTLTHELGHLFTLAHTFYGWESDNESYLDVIASNGGRTPEYTVNGVLVEKVVRSGGTENCQIAADGFCDTDPDFNFGFYSNGCTFNQDIKDPDSVLIPRSSASDNFMSYYNDACTNTFSNEQKEAILLDVISRGLDRIPTPTESAITSPVNIIWPTATAPTMNSLSELIWNKVENATLYSVSLNRTYNGTFVSRVNEWVTRDTSLWVELPNGANYEYTLVVRPINHLNFCNINNLSDTTRFINLGFAVGVENIETITSSKVYPNPSNRQAPVMVEFTTTETTDVTISIINTLGQSIAGRQTITLTPGTNIESLDMSMLPAGMYMINIESKQGRITHKVVLQ